MLKRCWCLANSRGPFSSSGYAQRGCAVRTPLARRLELRSNFTWIACVSPARCSALRNQPSTIAISAYDSNQRVVTAILVLNGFFFLLMDSFCANWRLLALPRYVTQRRQRLNELQFFFFSFREYFGFLLKLFSLLKVLYFMVASLRRSSQCLASTCAATGVCSVGEKAKCKKSSIKIQLLI